MRPNAAQLNRMQIREQEALNRQRRQQDDAAAQREAHAVRRTQAQYQHVTSHGYGRDGGSGANTGGLVPSAHSAGAGAAPASSSGDAQIRVYVRECDEGASQVFSYRETATGAGAPTGPSSPSGPSARSAVGSGGGSGSDNAPRRVASNASGGALPSIHHHPGAAAASNARVSASASGAYDVAKASTPDALTPNRARVPRYLQQRKAEMAAEKEAVAAEAERRRELAQIPAGQRRVTEEEKADTLRRLDERQQELEQQIAHIPIRFDTQSIQQRRRAIEEELREIDATRHKYSTKGPLFVPL